MRYSICLMIGAVLSAGCSELFEPPVPQIADTSFAEPWASEPQQLWPQILLTNAARFRNQTVLEGASAFLLETSDGRILAATAKHVIEPDITPTQLDSLLETWQMHPRTRPSEAVAIGGLLTPGFDPQGRDVLFLRAIPSQGTLPAHPLKIRASPVARGETVYLLGCPYSQSGCSQNVYRGRVSERDATSFTFSLDTPEDLMGFSGAPVIDAKGHAIGILTGSYDSQPKGLAVAGVAQALDELRGQIETLTPAAPVGAALASGAGPQPSNPAFSRPFKSTSPPAYAPDPHSGIAGGDFTPSFPDIPEMPDIPDLSPPNSPPGFSPGFRPGFPSGLNPPGTRPGFNPGFSPPGLSPGFSAPGMSPGMPPGLQPPSMPQPPAMQPPRMPRGPMGPRMPRGPMGPRSRR